MNRLAVMDASVRVVDTGSFTGAARLLRVGQPAVSKMIAQLEKRVGTKLLLRTTQGLTSTEAGENFYEHARRALEEVDEAEASSGDLRQGRSISASFVPSRISGRCASSRSPMTATCWLSPIAIRWRRGLRSRSRTCVIRRSLLSTGRTSPTPSGISMRGSRNTI